MTSSLADAVDASLACADGSTLYVQVDNQPGRVRSSSPATHFTHGSAAPPETSSEREGWATSVTDPLTVTDVVTLDDVVAWASTRRVAAGVIFYSVSHRNWLSLVLHEGTYPKGVYLKLDGCLRLCGPLESPRGHLRISRVDDDHWELAIIAPTDVFSAVCREISVVPMAVAIDAVQVE